MAHQPPSAHYTADNLYVQASSAHRYSIVLHEWKSFKAAEWNRIYGTRWHCSTSEKSSKRGWTENSGGMRCCESDNRSSQSMPSNVQPANERPNECRLQMGTIHRSTESRPTDPCIRIIHLGCNFQGPLIFRNPGDIRLKEPDSNGTLVIDVNALGSAHLGQNN